MEREERELSSDALANGFCGSYGLSRCRETSSRPSTLGS